MKNSSVGNRIKQLRLSKGWTLEELGKKLDTSKVTVYNWENGRNLPNKENLKKLAELGDMTVNELLSKNESKPPKNKFSLMLNKLIFDSRSNYREKFQNFGKTEDSVSILELISEYFKIKHVEQFPNSKKILIRLITDEWYKQIPEELDSYDDEILLGYLYITLRDMIHTENTDESSFVNDVTSFVDSAYEGSKSQIKNELKKEYSFLDEKFLNSFYNEINEAQKYFRYRMTEFEDENKLNETKKNN